MKTAVMGATGRIGSEVVRGLLASQRTVTALVCDTAGYSNTVIALQARGHKA